PMDTVTIGKKVYKVKAPEIQRIFREYTHGEGRITTLGVTLPKEDEEKYILVGTSTGRVYLHDPWGDVDEKEEGPYFDKVVYRNPDRKSITSVGGFCDVNKKDPKSTEHLIFVQVREFGVIILRDLRHKPKEIAGMKYYFKEIKRIESDHCGFCPVRSYMRKLFMPTSDHFLLVYQNGEIDNILLKSKGSPMCMDLIGDNVVVGSEDGNVCIYKNDDSYVISKVFDSPIFSLVIYASKWIVVGTVGEPIKVMEEKEVDEKCIQPKYETKQMQEKREKKGLPRENEEVIKKKRTLLEVTRIDFPAEARACGALTYTLHDGQGAALTCAFNRTFIAGFWDGSIRIYRQKKGCREFMETGVIESESRNSTTSLVWLVDNQLYSACEDGNLYLHEIFKTELLPTQPDEMAEDVNKMALQHK
ncbi:hypothetical protein PFISCL1PPCAC_2385, partial [Pristionchus fissidentatus]